MILAACMNLVYPVLIAVMMIIPVIVDGTAQYFYGFKSTNLRRIVTGLPAGVGLYTLLVLRIVDILRGGN